MNWITGKAKKEEMQATPSPPDVAMQARVAELEAKCGDLTSENERLIKENRALTDRVSMMERSRAPMDVPTAARFIEGRGVLWQQAADGRVEPICYCPTCKLVMTPLPSGYPEEIVCTRCKFKAAFHPEKLAEAAQEVRDLVAGSG